MALSAVIFDVDGTLIDSNAMHVKAWEMALQKHGYEVSPDRIEVEIGKGGDKVVPSILGGQIDRRDGQGLRKAHTVFYTKLAESKNLRAFEGVETMLAGLAARGLKIAIATSSSKDELKTTMRNANVGWLERFDAISTGDDAEETKPHPAILQAAIKKLRLAPTQCAMVGDTPYDADTARDAGAVCLGVTCGGMNDEKTLRAAGMRQVYINPAHIAEHLDEMLQIASPGSAIASRDFIETLMKQALDAAAEGLAIGEVPIGCVIARGNGPVIAKGHNELNRSQNKTAHAEMVAFGRIAGKVPPEARDLILVSTLEPCVMCLGASMEAAVDTIVFGLSAPADGGRSRIRPPISPESQMPRIWGNVLADQSKAMLQEFLKRPAPNPQQVQFVRQLLQMTRT